MAKTYANIAPAFDTWAGLIQKVNYVLTDMGTVVVTTDSTTNGALTSGNAYVNGYLTSNNLSVISAIRGGTATTSADLTLASNLVTSYAITIGNSTVNNSANSTVLRVGNSTVYSTINSTAFSGIANNANNFAGLSSTTWGTYITSNAATAYTNAASKADTAYTNAASKADTAYTNAAAYADTKAGTAYTNAASKADTAYTNAASKADTAYTNAASYADTKAATAYTNATSYASNATNISSGTLPTARLPATVNVSSQINLGANVYINTSAISISNSTLGFIITAAGIQGNAVSSNVTSFNSRAGAVTLLDSDITSALTYTPLSANTTGTISGSLTLTSGDLSVRDILSSRDVRAGNAVSNTVANSVGIQVSGNTTTYTTINSTAFSGTANNSTNFGGLSLGQVQGNAASNAAAAYSNAVANASYMAGQAYSNAVANAAAVYQTTAGLSACLLYTSPSPRDS